MMFQPLPLCILIVRQTGLCNDVCNKEYKMLLHRGNIATIAVSADHNKSDFVISSASLSSSEESCQFDTKPLPILVRVFVSSKKHYSETFTLPCA